MSDEKDNGPILSDEEWIDNQCFLLTQEQRIYPAESLLIEEMSPEEYARLWAEAQEVEDKDIISIEEIQL